MRVSQPVVEGNGCAQSWFVTTRTLSLKGRELAEEIVDGVLIFHIVISCWLSVATDRTFLKEEESGNACRYNYYNGVNLGEINCAERCDADDD